MGFPARYAGVCMKCNQAINRGDMISWSRKPGNKGVYHVSCGGVQDTPHEETEAPSEQEERELSGASMDAVQDALKVLLAAMQPKPAKPTIDRDAVERTVREILMSEGTLRIEVHRKDAPPVTLEAVHAQFPKLLWLVANRKHTYLYGPHGSGKSTGAQQAAESLGLRYGYISLTPQTPESRLIGYMTAIGSYVRTPFRDCYENGGVFCIDEMDNGGPSLLTTLNGALENGHMAFPDALVARHADFVLIGTGNTSGRGANPSYPERRPFDAAFGDRFFYLAWGYDEKLERKIARAINSESDSWTTWVQSIRKWANANHPRFVPSPRATFRIAEFTLPGCPLTQEDILDGTLWRGDTELASKVKANCPLPE